MNRDGWDPEHPEVTQATGVPKKEGGWLGWAIAAGVVAVIAGAWFFRS